MSCESWWGQNSTESAGQEVLKDIRYIDVTVTGTLMNLDNLTDKTRQSIAAAIQLAKDYSNVQGTWPFSVRRCA